MTATYVTENLGFDSGAKKLMMVADIPNFQEMSPHEFVLELEIRGKSLTPEVVLEVLTRPWWFVEGFVRRCLLDSSVFDDMFKDSAVMRTYIDICLPFVSAAAPFEQLARRRPGIVFRHYLSLSSAKGLLSSGEKIFERIVYRIAQTSRTMSDFPEGLWEKIEKIHKDAQVIQSMLD